MAQYIHLDSVRNVLSRIACEPSIAQQIVGLVDGSLAPSNYECAKGSAADLGEDEKVLIAINSLLDGNGVSAIQHDGELLAMYVDRGSDTRWTIVRDCQRNEWLTTTIALFEKHGGWEAVRLRRIPPDAVIRIGREEGRQE